MFVTSSSPRELQVKSRKLLISLAVVAVVVVIIVVLSAVLTVKKIVPVYHGFDGSEIIAPEGALAPDDLLSSYKGKSIVFLSKTNLMAELNTKYTRWHAFAVVKDFPNVVEIHFVRRTAIACFQLSTGAPVYVDCFGYVTEPSTNVIDITSAFNSRDVKEGDQNAVGTKFSFASDESNTRLGYILDSILATWQCWVEIGDVGQVLGETNVFTFNEEGSLVIHPRLNGYSVVQSPEVDLANRIIKAYSVYYNSDLNLHSDDITITVYKNGRISTPSK